MVEGTFNPEEPFSKEHLLNSIGFATFLFGVREVKWDDIVTGGTTETVQLNGMKMADDIFTDGVDGLSKPSVDYKNQSPYQTSEWSDYFNNKYGSEQVIHKSNVKFNERYYVEHTTGPIETFSKRNGVSGGHNYDEFINYFNNESNKYSLIEVGRKNHPDINGIIDVKYRAEYEKMNYAGKGTGDFSKIPVDTKPPFNKTVYDPKIISSKDLIDLSKIAVEEGLENGRFELLLGQPKVKIYGKVEYQGNVLKFEAYQDINNHIVANAYPVLEWGSN